MDILKLLKEGMSADEIYDDFMDALTDAQTEYKEYLEEVERRKKAQEAKELERAYKKSHLEECRSALGAAIVDYFLALEIDVNDKMYEQVDWIIDALPHIKVVKTGGRFF